MAFSITSVQVCEKFYGPGTIPAAYKPSGCNISLGQSERHNRFSIADGRMSLRTAATLRLKLGQA